MSGAPAVHIPKKVEKIPGVQDIYLDEPGITTEEELTPHTAGGGDTGDLRVTPGNSWESHDVQSAGPAVHGGYSDPSCVGVNSETFTEEAEETDEEKRAHDRKPSERNVEAALELFERNCSARKAQQWQGQQRWAEEHIKERLGRILHCDRFVEMLAKVGVTVWLNDYGRLGRIGVNALIWTGEKWEQQTVTSLHNGPGPEYSVMRFNRFNVPTNERYRGWRTALLAMIDAGACTEAHALEAFGPAVGEASSFYLKQLFDFRNLGTARKYHVPPPWLLK